MLKFKGKPKGVMEFLEGLKTIYGEKTTLKEVILMVEAMRK